MIIAVAIPVIVTLVYQRIGSPEHMFVAGPGQPAPSPSRPQASIGDLVGELKQRLEAEPDNPQGWFLLGRTFMKLQRYDEAVQAYERLNEVLPDNPSVMISWSDALSMANGGQVPEKAVQLLDKALAVEPEALSALWLAGNAAAQRGQDQKALTHWSRALLLLDEDPDMQQELRGLIAQVEQRSGLKADVPAPLPEIMSAVSGPAAAAETGGEGLQVEVALDAELMDLTTPGDAVFVYAKAVSGPPVPLAVARLRVADLPLKVALNDGMAMMPQMKLSSFERVMVGARISKSGQATPQAGDLQSSEVETASDSDDSIQLLINAQRP